MPALRFEGGNGRRVISLMSGGLDTTILSVVLKQAGYDVQGIMFDYGQTNLTPTLHAAYWYSHYYAIPLRVVTVPLHWSKGSVTSMPFVREGITEENVYRKNVKELSWIPARNLIFLLLAGGIASETGIEDVYAGFQFDENEWRTYDALANKAEFGGADLTPEFLRRANEIAPFCFKTPVRFVAPFIDYRLDCLDIIDLARGIPDFDPEHTYSCRYHVPGPCGECEQCVIREKRLERWRNPAFTWER